ncbi:hypothetical protein N7528_010342 [Penicillium herquei]|nr:hypothetical protein N7528_010342 [Penicillium herquei]
MDRLSPQEMRSEQGDFISGRDERSLSTPWVGQPHFTRQLSIVRPMNVQQQEESDGASPSNLTASLSPTSTTSHHYLSQSSDGAHSTPMSITADGSSPQTTGSFGEITEGDHHTDPPYSQLIYQALSEAQDCKLQLQDIYAWFEKNTSKGKDPTTKGWQNSIRHNLSMNQGFYAIKNETRGGKRTMNYWSLTPEAIRNGKVESTTRFRKSTPKKIHSTDSPARRQGGNQKGKVTEKWNELRQANQNRERQARNAAGSALQAPEQQQAPTPIDDRYPPQSEMSAYQVSPQPETQIPPYQVPPVAPASQFPVRSTLLFGMETVTGCSPPPHGSSPVFCERNQPSSAYMAALQLRRAQMGQRPYVQSGFNPGPNNGSVAGTETHPNIQNGV